LVLGIETSCDETAAAVVRDGRQVLSNVVYSQVARHRVFGGVVPEIASRLHVETLPLVVQHALNDAGVQWEHIEEVAVTRGPGLAPALLVGTAAARALGLSLGRPVRGVSHLVAHVYSLFLGLQAPEPAAVSPMLVLLVSGGHTMQLKLTADGGLRLLGETVDDAAGEALDKGAVVMGLGFALTEEMEFDEQGRLLNPSFRDYHIPRADELPRLETVLIEGYEPRGPFGAKAIGEVAVNGPAPAVANALFHALGIRLRSLPFTPERVLRALGEL